MLIRLIILLVIMLSTSAAYAEKLQPLDVQEFKRVFNEQSDHPRVVTLLSPT